jgi:hypothetical protein
MFFVVVVLSTPPTLPNPPPPPQLFTSLHIQHFLVHPPDHVLFPFLHGLEGENNVQNTFFANASAGSHWVVGVEAPVAVRSASGEGVRIVNTTRPVVPPIDTSVGAGGSANAGGGSESKTTTTTTTMVPEHQMQSNTTNWSDPKYRAIEVSYRSYAKRMWRRVRIKLC